MLLGCARPTGVVMVAPSEVPRNAEGAQSEGRARERSTKRGQGHYKGRSPEEPRPDDSYSYQPSPEPSQYSAFDNTH